MNIKLNRNKKNDIILETNNLVSIQNILVSGSILMLILCFFRFIKLDIPDFFGNLYLSPFKLASLGDGLSVLASEIGQYNFILKIFSFLYLLPIVTIIIFFVNRFIKNTKLSYRLVMVQYLFIIVAALINVTSIKLLKSFTNLSNIANMGGFFDLNIKITFVVHIYSLLNLILFVVAFYGITNTGIKEIYENLEAKDLFSKEFVKSTGDLAKNLGSSLNTAATSAVASAQKAMEDVKSENQQKNENSANNTNNINNTESTNNTNNTDSTNNLAETAVEETKQITTDVEVEKKLDSTIECKACGSKNKPNSNFCTSCGTKIEK